MAAELKNMDYTTIEGFSLYEVNIDGCIRVKSNHHFMKPQLRKDGYYSLRLRHDSGKTKNVTIHRCLMQTFVSNPDGKLQVNHINGVKTDNRLSNLEWCTAKENRIHAVSTGLITNTTKGRRAHSKLDEIQVMTIRKCLSDGLLCKSLAGYFKVSPSLISAIKRNVAWLVN